VARSLDLSASIIFSNNYLTLMPDTLIFKNQKALTVELDIAFIKGKSLDAHKQVFLDTILD